MESKTWKRYTEDGWRYYEDDQSKRYISVTQVLDLAVEDTLKKWFIKSSAGKVERTQTDTAQKGIDLHERASIGIEDRFNGLIKSRGIEILDTEVVTFSKIGFAGQRDYKAVIDGKKYILDVKTGFFGAKAGAQLGAYSLAANERGEDIEGIGIISLPRDETKPAQFFDYSANFENCQYGFCSIFDYFKFTYHKKLKGWEFQSKKSVLNYEWSF